jgi:preprotein translocase subunit SecE
VSGVASEGSSSPAAADGTRGSEVDPLDPGPGGGFMATTLDELSRVVWPSRQQLFSESVGVILMVALSAAAIAAIDRFYSWASSQVFR